MDKEIGIFEEDSLYQLIADNSDNSYAYGNIIVLCTKGNYNLEQFVDPVWEGVVVFSSTSLENHTPIYSVGYNCDTWNDDKTYGNDLGPGE